MFVPKLFNILQRKSKAIKSKINQTRPLLKIVAPTITFSCGGREIDAKITDKCVHDF